MSVILKDDAAVRRYYEPTVPEANDLQFFVDRLTRKQLQRVTKFVKKYHKATCDEMKDSVEANRTMVLSQGESVCLMHVCSLLPTEDVSDSVIHYVVRAMRTTIGVTDPSVYFFSSFFFTTLFQEWNLDPRLQNVFCYSQVERWSSKLPKPINEMKTLIFFKNHMNAHWILYVIFLEKKTIQEFDSLGGGKTVLLKGLYEWLRLEMVKVDINLNETDWHLYPSRTNNTPQQPNTWDCGIYMLLFGVCIAQGLPLTLCTQKRVNTA